MFVDKKRKSRPVLPPPLSHIVRVSSLKILGVTMTDGLSASDHVGDIIARCAQTLYALRVLRAHGMGVDALQTIFQSVAVAKVIYASSAWWGFTSANDRQRVDAFLRRSIRSGYCPSYLPPFEEQCEVADQQLFKKILANPHHVLYHLLPPPTVASQNYFLRSRPHYKQLPPHTGHLTDSNFITRLLYREIY